MTQDCGEVLVQPDPPAPPSERPALVFLLALLVALAIFEGWALATHHATVSQALQHWFARHVLLRLIVFVGWIVVGWHVLWGFPW